MEAILVTYFPPSRYSSMALEFLFPPPVTHCPCSLQPLSLKVNSLETWTSSPGLPALNETRISLKASLLWSHGWSFSGQDCRNSALLPPSCRTWTLSSAIWPDALFSLLLSHLRFTVSTLLKTLGFGSLFSSRLCLPAMIPGDFNFTNHWRLHISGDFNSMLVTSSMATSWTLPSPWEAPPLKF